MKRQLVRTLASREVATSNIADKVDFQRDAILRHGNIARLIVVLAMSWVFPAAVCAHDMSQSESKLEVRGRQVRVAFRLNLLELAYVDANGNGFISYDELDSSIDRIYQEIKLHYILRGPELPVQITLERYGVIEDHILDAAMVYQFAHDVTDLSVTSTLDQITRPSHQHLTSVNLNGAVHEAVLNATTPVAVFTRDNSPALKTFWSFLRLGVMHIFTGYDHLAFLIGLLIVTRNIGSLVKIITSFTLAHSITLALATFDIIVLPSRLTECVIALSIVYVALENLLGFRAIERYRITFLFGLAHGFGFSNVLRDMELSRVHLGLSLFSFNLGVEIGQLAFVIVLFPLVLYVVSVRWRRQFQTVVSLLVLCLAVYWFIQRAFLI